MGKTALGACIARSIAEAQVPTLFFSQEMTAPSLAFRVLADMCFDHRDPLEYFKITKGELTADQGQRVVEAQRRLRSLPLEIDQQDGLTISQIATRARKRNLQLARKGRRLGVIIVDHLHLIRASARYSGNRVAEVTEISGGLKSLAKELDVAVVALAQLNRALEAREMKRPTLADLRDSGSIEQDADTIIFLFREAYLSVRQQLLRRGAFARCQPPRMLLKLKALRLGLSCIRSSSISIFDHDSPRDG
jgi:replicative DNA helicase